MPTIVEKTQKQMANERKQSYYHTATGIVSKN